MKKRLFAMVLSLVMVVSMLPMLSFSVSADTEDGLLCEKIPFHSANYVESEHFCVSTEDSFSGWEMGSSFSENISCKNDYNAQIVRVEMVLVEGANNYATAKVSSGVKRETNPKVGSKIHIDDIYADNLYFVASDDGYDTFFVRDIVIYYMPRVAEKPTTTGLQIYDGTEKTGVSLTDGYNTIYQLSEGCISATQPGTYTATFALKTDCEWEDRSTEPVELKWSICESETLTYTPGEGECMGDVFHAIGNSSGDDGWYFENEDRLLVNTDEDFVEIVGADVRISKGVEYYANLASTRGNISAPEIVDGGISVHIDNIFAPSFYLLSEEYSIYVDQITVYYVQDKKVEKPEPIPALYTGGEVCGIDTGSNLGTAYSLTGGRLSAIEPGIYFAIFSLNPGYIWEDGTKAPVSVSWTLVGTEAISEEPNTLGQSEHFVFEGTYDDEKGWAVGASFHCLSVNYEDPLEMFESGFTSILVGMEATVTDDSAMEHIHLSGGEMSYENGTLRVFASSQFDIIFECDDEISDIYLKNIIAYYVPMGTFVDFNGEKDLEQNGIRIHATSCASDGWKIGGGSGISIMSVSDVSLGDIIFMSSNLRECYFDGWETSHGNLVKAMGSIPSISGANSLSVSVSTQEESDIITVNRIYIGYSPMIGNCCVPRPTVTGLKLASGVEQSVPLSYDGTEQFGVENIDYLGKAYTLIYGDLSATRVGNYKAYFKLKPGYFWEDGTTDDLYLSWGISMGELIYPEYLGEKDGKSFQIISDGYTGDMPEMISDSLPIGWALGPLSDVDGFFASLDCSSLSVTVKPGLSRQIESVTLMAMTLGGMPGMETAQSSMAVSSGTLTVFEPYGSKGETIIQFNDVNAPQFTISPSFLCIVSAVYIQYSMPDVCYVPKPTAKSGIGYTGTEVVGVETDEWLDTAYSLIGGQLSATEPSDDYYAVFKLKDGYAWSDGDSGKTAYVPWQISTYETIEKGKNKNRDSSQFILECADSPLLGWTVGLQGDARISVKSGLPLLIDSVELSIYDPDGATSYDLLSFSSGDMETVRDGDSVLIRVYDVEAPDLRFGIDFESLANLVVDEHVSMDFPMLSINSVKIMYKTADTVYVEKPAGAFAEYTGKETTGIDTNNDLNVAYTVTDGIVAASDCGVYSATFTLNDGYTWMDGTSDPVTVKWGIGISETITCIGDLEENPEDWMSFASSHFVLIGEAVPPLTLVDYCWQVSDNADIVMGAKEEIHYGILGIEADTVGGCRISAGTIISGTSGEVMEQFPLLANETIHVFDVNNNIFGLTVDGPKNESLYGITGMLLINKVRIYHDRSRCVFPPVAISDFKGLFYTGEEQRGVQPLFEDSGDYGVLYELTDGVEFATEVGKYSATYTILDPGYCWPDGSTGTWTVEWEIKESIAIQQAKSDALAFIDNKAGRKPSERVSELVVEAKETVQEQTTIDGIETVLETYIPSIELLAAKDGAEGVLTALSQGKAPELLANLISEIESQTTVAGVEDIASAYIYEIQKPAIKAQLAEIAEMIAPYDTDGSIRVGIEGMINWVDSVEGEEVLEALEEANFYLFPRFQDNLLETAEEAITSAAEGYTADRITRAVKNAMQGANDAETFGELIAAIENGKEMVKAAKEKTVTEIGKAAAAATAELEALAGTQPSEEVTALLNEAKTNIGQAKNLGAVNPAKEAGLAAISEQLAREALAEAKASAKNALESAAGENSSSAVQMILDEAEKAVDKAETQEDVGVAKEEGLSAIAAQLQIEADARALEVAKEAAKTALDNAAGQNPSDATARLLNIAKEAVEKATNMSGVDTAKEMGLTAISAQVEAEEAAAEALAEAKEAAISALEEAAGENPSETVTNVLNEAKGAVNKATDIAGVNTAKENGLVAITDQIQADADEKALEDAKNDALKALEEAAGENPSETVTNVLNAAKKDVIRAVTIDEVDAVEEAGLSAIANQIQTEADSKTLNDAKDAAVKALEEAAGENPAETVKKILNAAKKDVNYASTLAEVESAKEAGLSAIAEELKALADAKALAEAKESAAKALKEATGEKPSDAVGRILSDALLAIEKASVLDAVGSAKEAGLSAIAAQLALEGDEKALTIVKEAAKTALDNAAGENPSDALYKIVNDAKDAVDAAENADAVNAAKDAGLSAIAAQLQKEADEQALSDAKKAAKDALTEAVGETPSDALSAILKDAMEAVDKGETVEAVGAAKEAGLSAIAAQLQAEGDEKALDVAKEAAKAALDNAAGENPSEEMTAIVAAAKDAVDAAKNADAVNAVKEAGLSAIAEQLEKEKEPSVDVLLGDANGDGAVDMKDVLLLRKFLADLSDEIENENADVNEDGSLDMKDVLMIRKYLAGMIEKFGV